MSEMLTLEAFEEASIKVKEVTQETKLVESPYLTAATGNRVWLKPENMQRTGAYKVRGAYYKISTLTPEELSRGIITASAGNHAQGVAFAATRAGAKSIVVMPTTTPLIKVERTKDYGAEVVLHGDVYDEACEYAMHLAETEGYTFIHPFNDPVVATGQGTIAKLYNPKIRVIGVEPAGAACMKASVEAGHVVKLPAASTIADGTAVLEPGDLVYPYVRDNVDEIITVEDEELIVSFLDMVENHKMVVENSGLLTVAALKHLPPENKRVVSILSGGNMDVITMSSVVQHGLIQRGRIFTVCVLLPDRPGMLLSVASIIARENGNVIKLEHNQFVSTNRNAAVELRVTVEAFGEDHKRQIVDALEAGGFDPSIVQTSL